MAALFKSTTTYDPMACLLNDDDEKKRDELTQRWKDNKLDELNFVGVVGALLAGVLTSTGSWPTILPNGTISPWTVRACWYIGILFALGSVLTAAQQSIRLHRLACHDRANTSIRRLLRRRKPAKDGSWQPQLAQVYMWQLSSYLLTASALAMVTGMFILIWSSTGNLGPDESWWNNDSKLAVTFSVVALLVGAMFAYQQVTLYSFAGADDRHDSDSQGTD